MESPAATADVGPLLVSAAFQLVGLVSGAALREATQLVVGSDPRRPRFWLTESLVVVVFSAALGVAVSFRLDLGVAGPPLLRGSPPSPRCQASTPSRRLEPQGCLEPRRRALRMSSSASFAAFLGLRAR